MTENNTLTNEELKARIALLESQLSSRGTSRLTMKVGEKGTFSLYGLGKFPVSLYEGQWERLLAYADDIRATLTANVDNPVVVAARTKHAAKVPPAAKAA